VPKSSSLAIVGAFVAASALATPQVAAAQRAIVRPVGRPIVVRPIRPPIFVGGFGFGYPYLYNPWWAADYGYGYSPYGPYPAYGGYSAWDVASLRLQITPREAEVFVDGYRAGIVDNFDGIFQRLHVRPGGHDLVVYMPGFRTFSEHIYASPSSSQSIKMTLLPLAPGEAMGPPPQPSMPPGPPPGAGRGGMRVMPPVQVGQGGNYMQPQGPPPAGDAGLPPIPPGATPVGPPSGVAAPPAGEMPPPPPVDPSAYGTLALRVQPASGPGALILIDGERWAAPSTSDQLLVRLAEGRHHIEVRKPGFATFTADVDVTRGVSTPLNIGLVRR
jgi:hypothetical protein